jgi:hypothetical protein
MLYFILELNEWEKMEGECGEYIGERLLLGIFPSLRVIVEGPRVYRPQN